MLPGACTLDPAKVSVEDTLWVLCAKAGYRTTADLSRATGLSTSVLCKYVRGWLIERPRTYVAWRLSWALFGREATTRDTVTLVYRAIDESRRRYLEQQGQIEADRAAREALRKTTQAKRTTPPSEDT